MHNFFSFYDGLSVGFFAFFGTVVAYNFVKYNALARLNKNQIRKEVKGIVLLSFLASVACFYFYLQLQTPT